MSVFLRVFGAGLLASLTGCDNPQTTVELHSYLQAEQRHANAAIEPLPVISAAPVFTYGATALRNPFQAIPGRGAGSWQVSLAGDESDADRPREFLEGFDLEQFEMVGTLSSELQTNALLRANGVIHRLKVGDYLGRNNGQVSSIQAQQIEVFELITDGRGGWLERSLTIPLKQQS
ncbi:pilus assembly protein PilP [Pseudomonas fragi]|uniref:Pilus assembly protein PilP n=1 Tax=Pseudomonas fragi TaxID=296 RepID=A0A267AVW6_PSEFR|nr:pilus assembly protein PilP [Pseudomonas fragi]PAA15917.1 pilus assembly protein PilP [Pseudomonas fragi]